MAKNTEFRKFDKTMRAILWVKHDEIKAQLEAERREKKKKRNPKTTSALDRVSSGDKA